MAVLGLGSESLNSQTMTIYLAVNNPARAGTACVGGRGYASGSGGLTGPSLLSGLKKAKSKTSEQGVGIW